jgi:hypothetical protein
VRLIEQKSEKRSENYSELSLEGKCPMPHSFDFTGLEFTFSSDPNSIDRAMLTFGFAIPRLTRPRRHWWENAL